MKNINVASPLVGSRCSSRSPAICAPVQTDTLFCKTNAKAPAFFTHAAPTQQQLHTHTIVLFCDSVEEGLSQTAERVSTCRGILVTPGKKVFQTQLTESLWQFTFAPSMLPTLHDTLRALTQLLDQKCVERQTSSAAFEYAEAIIRSVPGFFFVIDESSKLIFWNEVFEKITERDSTELLHSSLKNFFPPKEQKALKYEIEKLKTNSVGNIQTQLLRKKNPPLPVLLSGCIFKKEDTEYIIGMGFDISAVSNLTTKLSQRDKLLSDMASSFPGVIYQVVQTKKGNRKVNYVSDGIKRLLDIDLPNEKIIDAFMNRVHADDIDTLENIISESISTATVMHHEFRFVRSDGTILWFKTIATPTETEQGYVLDGHLFDITEQQKLKETIVQNEKMMSLGGLAAGMSHEINNPLAGIMQNVQVLQQRLNLDLPVNHKTILKRNLSPEAMNLFFNDRSIHKILHSMQDASIRVSTIVRDMLSFARGESSNYEKRDIHQLLDNTLNIAATDYDLKKHFDFKQIEIHRNYSASTPLVECVPSRIQQVFMNILKNGAHAMYEAHASMGIISKFFLTTWYNQKDEVIGIKIADNGPGIPEDVKQRIFEPFFTTKTERGGTGLGLSVTYFIITNNHNGKITVCSEPGKGSCFEIQIPRVYRKQK